MWETNQPAYWDKWRFDSFVLFLISAACLQAHRESTGTVSMSDGQFKDPVAAAEELAFCKACARFGFGLYLYHEDEATENKSL